MKKLQLEDGKYELRFHEDVGVLCAFRHGEPWRDFSGDKFVYLLMEAALKERDSRAMFISRLENMAKNGDAWLTIAAALALLNDCDTLAAKE